MIRSSLGPYLFMLFFLFIQSCGLYKALPNNEVHKTSSVFIDNVKITLDGGRTKTGTIITHTNSGSSFEKKQVNYVSELQGIEFVAPVLFRYAILLDVEIEKLVNTRLFNEIDRWWGVPYKYGGTTKTGIDCSSLVQTLALEAYGLKLPRTSKDQANYCKPIQRNELKEGDLVFFNTSGGISHVGLYLSNNKFVHASTSQGVVISDLDQKYWAERFVKAGRLSSEVDQTN